MSIGHSLVRSSLAVLPSRVSVLRAGKKFFASKLRSLGLTAEASDWARRAEVCERCPVRIIKCNVSYCGQPYLRQVRRDSVTDGCGCPTRAKAKDPAEHCPITDRRTAAVQRADGGCDCQWCATRQ